jgi:ribosomal protein S18 acetylase RimI-like enzyme
MTITLAHRAKGGHSGRVHVAWFHRRHLDGAAKLLAESLGTAAPSTGVRYRLSDVAAVRAGIAAAVERGPAVVALDGSAVVGFMIAPLPKVPGTGGSRMTVLHHAAWPAVARNAYRRMYEEIAGALVAAGCFEHSVLVPTDQQAVVDALFELQFGIDQIKGTRTLPGIVATPSNTIRAAHTDDLDRLLELFVELTQFHSRSPMLAPAMVDLARARAMLVQEISAQDHIVLVACDGDVIVGMIQAEADRLWAGTTTIGMNIVTEDARSTGVGTTMLDALCAEAANSGADRCAVGWDSANLVSDAFYRARGFIPVRYELHRTIDQRVAWANDTLDYSQFTD